MRHKSKSSRAEAVDSHDEQPDPFDFSALEAGIQKAVDELRSKLSALRAAGGRFDPQLVENLRIKLDKKHGTFVALGDVAQVIPKRGSSLTVIVAQEEVMMPLWLTAHVEAS